jgi:hypothetical protein
MADASVSIIITVKAGEVSETIEKAISVMEMESDLNKVFQSSQQQVTAMLFDLLESQLHAYVSTQTEWKNIGTEQRRVLLESGSITYRRHIYKDKQGKRHKPFDDLLHLRAYQRNSRKVEAMAASLAAISSFRNAAELFSYVIKEPVSASSIHRMTGRVGAELQAMERIMDEENLEPGKIVAPRIAAEADGVFIKLQGEKAKCAEVKVALFYTGKQAISPHRHRLINKVISCQLGMSNEEWQQHLAALAYRSYDMSKVRYAQIGGDGAKWVRNSFDYLGVPGHHLLDRFHVIRSINTAFGSDLNGGELQARLFSQGFAAVETDLLRVIARQKGAKKDQQIRCFDYLKANQDALIDLDKRGLGEINFCSMGAMEGNVDKLVAQRMKGNGRSWSVKGAQRMLAVLRYKSLIKTEAFVMLTIPKNEAKSRWKYQRYKDPEWTPKSASVPMFSSTHGSDNWVQLLKCKVNDMLSINGFF